MGRLGIKLAKNVFTAGKAAHQDGGGFAENVELEPGRYVCIITKARAVEANGEAKFVLDLKVAGDAEQAGGRVSLWYSLTEEKIVWLFRDLAKLGYDVEGLDEDTLADIIDDLEEKTPVIRISAKRKGEFVNYFLDKLLEELTAAEAEGGSTGPEVETEAEAAPPKTVKKVKTAAAAEPEAEPEPEPEAEAEEPEGDELTELDRSALKKILLDEDIPFAVNKKTTDDAIRDAIREHRTAAEEPVGEEPEPEPEAEVELEVGAKVIATIRGKDVKGCIVKSIDEKTGKVKVMLPDKTLATVSAEQLAM